METKEIAFPLDVSGRLTPLFITIVFMAGNILAPLTISAKSDNETCLFPGRMFCVFLVVNRGIIPQAFLLLHIANKSL